MAGSYDPNKDYAAAIKNESDPAKKQQLISERQNKIDAMNAAGTNKNNYSNDIYTGGSSANKNSGSTSGGSKNNSSGGYYDPNKDYAAAIKNATSDAERNQLIAERQNKIDAMNAAGTNTGGYNNSIYNTPSKESYGYFDSGKDYAAAIAAETDPVKKQQLIQERQNKLDYLNATGQNSQGYNNSIYGNGNATSFGGQAAMGQYQNQDAILQDAALGKLQLTQAENAALQSMNLTADDLSASNPLAQTNYEQALALATTPEQKAALTAYFTRLNSNADPSDVQGTYAGDYSMSLPDQALLVQYQAAYNQAKERGDTVAMEAARQMAEKLRDNYRYYPLANSNGYGLGENNIGWIRDIVVRVDDLGRKYVDQYNRNTVTTQAYDKDGNLSWKNTRSIDGHDDYVARQWDRADEYGNDYMAFRIADANDANLSAAELVAKYGAQNGMGRELYGNARVSSKIENGKTLADVYAEQGITGYGTQNTAQAATLGANAGQTDIFSIYGYFDPNKDYAAAIQAATSQAEREALMAERQNKINYLNGTGQNANGYTNAIYGQTTQQTQQQPLLQEAVLPEYVGMTQEELQEQYNALAEQLAAARQQQLNLTLQQSQAAQDTANQEYDDLARQAYITMRQSQNALPQQLAALGISGGGSETANLKLQTNYQNNLNTNEQQRAQMLKEYALANLQAQTQANTDISGYYSDALQNALNAWQNEMANQNAYNQWAANFQLQQQQYKDSLSQYEYEKQQNELALQIELALQTGDYSKLKALGYDTSYLEKQKQAQLAELALAAANTRSSNSSSGGKVYTYNDDVEDADVVLDNSSDQLTPNGYTFLLMNYKALGDTEAFAQKVSELMANGSVSRADYEKFLKAYS